MLNFDDDTPDAPPIPFKFRGQEFHAAGVAPAGLIVDIINIPDEEGVGLSFMAGFLDKVLLPESATRFAAVLRDPEHPVKTEKVSEIFSALVGVYTNSGAGKAESKTARPTKAPSSSSSGSGSTGTSSMVDVPLPDSTPAEPISAVS